MNKSTLIVTGVVVLVISSIIIFYMIMGNTPEQPYKEVKKVGDIEIRYYPKAWMATVTSKETTYKKSSNNNFQKLAAYIFGSNQGKKEIAMTAPVRMDFDVNQSQMSFVMPEGYDRNNLPAPLNSEIQLHESEAEYVAVLRFGGYASDDKIEKKKKQLFAELESLGIQHSNNIHYLGYNAPWDIVFRRNEVVATISMEDALKVL
ncbi:MAG: heme-binding protein [Cyclobacteriaceae bacterium]